MKSWELDRRLVDLSGKMEPVKSDVVRLDFDSFPEAEQQLFSRVLEIREKYGATTPEEIRTLGKAGWTKYDELTVAGVQMHFYRKPKRFGSSKKYG